MRRLGSVVVDALHRLWRHQMEEKDDATKLLK